MDWITGDKFKSLAKWHYAPQQGEGLRTKNIFTNDDYRYIENTLDKSRVVDGDIIYTPGFFADSLMEELKDFNTKVIVITHNADTNISFTPPSCVIKWFSQNVNIIHERIESIPIGLENDIWFPWLRKKEKMLAKLQEPRNYQNLVYMNHNISTNPLKRTKPYEVLKDKSWVTTDMGVNDNRFDEYLNSVYNHKFVVCPEGNGIDTHRIWECLYMGTIPITEDNINMSFYRDLPTLSVRDWDELNAPCLDRYFNGIKAFNNLWSHDLLKFEYWKNKIYGFSNNIISN